ncbi:MAG: transglycosylase domain-containing protein [Thermodesulfobacteriota bacterium]|nr:transglycosylase domain-containing protein [Thermodesulfobacteriota bacterium]
MKWLKILAFSFIIMLILISSVLVLCYKMVWVPSLEMMKKENIKKIIFAESPVYFDDEKNIIGVFFQEEHRRYLEFEDIPKDFINALIASEDHNFYRHHGFDLKAILRALFANIKQLRIAQGGSTITQQTAKNIFKREKRSLRSKVSELIHAIMLESYYTKEEILEFYSNQFFVNSNGRGIGVAAEYFFNKPANELSLQECAFIAGAVKGPSWYNPFTKKTPQAKEKAAVLARYRRDYVYRNMYKLGMISLEEYEANKGHPIAFQQGRIGYRLNVILDYIREQFQSEPFHSLLVDEGINNIATSGIKIYTTIDKEIQEGALLSLRKNLSYLETKLNRYDRKKVQHRYKNLTGGKLSVPKMEHFCFGRISKVVTKGTSSYIDIEFVGAKGRIDYQGMHRLAGAWMKSRTGEWTQFDKRSLPRFLYEFRPGDMIFVNVKRRDPRSNLLIVELEQRPEIEGGVVVLQNGEIIAMAGGFENEFFNRTVDAKRQLGSIFKPIVFTAALQLGWNNLDALENNVTEFEFEDTFYSPRPDHEGPSPLVSMAWAGVKSENLATVWLLYHLCDRLNMTQFRQIADKVGLLRKEGETPQQYKTRIRDKNGVIIDESSLKEAAFEEAKEELITDLVFEGKDTDVERLRSINYERFSNGMNENVLSFETVEKLTINQQKQYINLKGETPYNFKVLSRIREFRILVGLKYLVRLATQMGVTTQLEGVLSFPLGSNSISILESALVYHTILSGRVYPITEDGSLYYTPVIKRIEDPQGEVIYEYRPKAVPILDEKISNMVIPILRHSIKHGTGKRAEGNIILNMKDITQPGLDDGIHFKIPVFGKTGTSNEFRNSSFCGFIPGPTRNEEGLDIENSYIIASYIGYDNNTPLRSSHIAIYGSSGALPLWIDVANIIVNTDNFSRYIDIAGLVFQGADEVPLQKAPDMLSVYLDPITGLPVSTDSRNWRLEDNITIESYGKMDDNNFKPSRFFLPSP